MILYILYTVRGKHQNTKINIIYIFIKRYRSTTDRYSTAEYKINSVNSSTV